MADRGGAPPLNHQVRSQDIPAAQQSQVENSGVVTAANSRARNQSEVQHIHLHTQSLVHRSHWQPYNQGRQNNAQLRNHQGNSRKRAYEPDLTYADVYRSADQREQRLGVHRLPFVGEFLQQEPHDKVKASYHGALYKDQLELMGGNQSSINWFAPDLHTKSVYGHQFVAKVATDDESLMALVKTIQLEARRQGSPIVNLWMQCQDPDEQRKLSRTEVGQTYNQLAHSYNTSIQRCTACGKGGHRVRNCPEPDPVHLSISMCPVCDTQDHTFDVCFEVRKRLPLVNRSHGLGAGPQDPDIIEDYKWFSEMLMTRRANKPPVRTAQVSWTAVAQYLHHHAPDFKFQGAPWSLQFTCKMAKAHRGDAILNGRTHWLDWDPRKGDRDEDLATDPLCQSMAVIVESIRKRELTSERFVTSATRKALNRNVTQAFVEHLPVDRGSDSHVKIEQTEAHASFAHDVGGVAPRPAPDPAGVTGEEQDLGSRDRAMPLVIKTEPDTEGSGITVPAELPKVPTEYVSVAERCLQIFDDEEIDPAEFIFESMPPTRPHKAVIQPPQVRPQAAGSNSLWQYGERSVAGAVADPDTDMTGNDPPGGVMESIAEMESPSDALEIDLEDEYPSVAKADDVIDYSDSEQHPFRRNLEFPSQREKKGKSDAGNSSNGQ